MKNNHTLKSKNKSIIGVIKNNTIVSMHTTDLETVSKKYVINNYQVYDWNDLEIYKKLEQRFGSIFYKKYRFLYNSLYKKVNKSFDYSNFVIPLLRSVYPELITQDLFDIAPMSSSVGLSFYVKNPKIKKE